MGMSINEDLKIGEPAVKADPLLGRRSGDGLSGIVELKEFTNFSGAKFVKIGLGRVENFAGLFVSKGAISQGHDPLPLYDIFINLVVNHFPLACELGKVVPHLFFAGTGAREFHFGSAAGQGAKLDIVGHQF